MTQREVLIVHYNTPEMTEAAILSLRKHGGENYHVTIFDNSDARPFTKQMDGVDVMDNTLGQLIDLDAELKKFPERSRNMGNAYSGDFPSARHMMSVQWFMDNHDFDFLLMDSDVLIREGVEFMFMQDQCCCGHIQTWQKAGNPGHKDRLVPLVCYINAPMCKKCGVRYFDPNHSFALLKGSTGNPENWYDTGSSFLYEIRSHKNGAHGKAIDIRPLHIHYGSGSWKNTGQEQQIAWLNKYQNLWKPSDDYVLGDPNYKRPANKTAKIFVCAHSDFQTAVDNPVYEVIDASNGGDEMNGMPGSFYSELLHMNRVANMKKLPTIVGFHQYRKYFHWMSDVPDLSKWIKRYGCLVSQAKDLDMSMHAHYKNVGNIDDLDLVTKIIEYNFPEFGVAWHKALQSKLLHTASMFVMRTKDFKRMLALINGIVDEYVHTVGKDIDAHILKQKAKYHIPTSPLEYQRRIGGQICERIVSAWIDWQFPEAKEVPIKVTSKPIASN